MIQWISEAISYVQFSESLRWVLLFIGAVLSALFTELIFKDRDWTLPVKWLVKWLKRRKWVKKPKWLEKWEWTENREQKTKQIVKWLWYSMICMFVFLMNVAITLILLSILLQFNPQQESLSVLLEEIAKTQGIDFVFPLVAALLAGWALNSTKKKKRKANIALCLLLVLSTISSSIMYFLDSFSMIQHPQYSAPIESISSIINSRMNVYPFILSGDALREVGDGSNLLLDNSDHSGNAGGTSQEQIEIKEPTDFNGYIDAILDDIYVSGKGRIDYLLRAYELFLDGKHNDNYFSIGIMWHFMYIEYYNAPWLENDPSITAEICLDEALEAYQKSVETAGSSPAIYTNIAIIYHIMGERQTARNYMQNALNLNGDKGFALSTYTGYIYDWIGDEDLSVLLNDAGTILNREKNLSMYILYGACAAALNTNTEFAYQQLDEADTYYNGQSAMIKLLKCICADLAGINIDESVVLQDIYSLESMGKFTGMENKYLIRYLFLNNRFNELWGYIAELGTTENITELDVQSIAMKASLYAKDMAKAASNKKEVELLLEQIEEKLENTSDTDEKNILLLSQMLLQNCLGETISSDIELGEIEMEEVSDLQYVFYATEAFNKRNYADAIEYCNKFFDIEKEQEKAGAENLFSSKQLEPQEQMALLYHVQLVFADSHFQYAQTKCRNHPKEWKEHMKIAEQECAAFEQSTKSLFYIGEQFQSLQDRIDIANGKLPEKEERK